MFSRLIISFPWGGQGLDHPVEVGLKPGVVEDAKLAKFSLGLALGEFHRNAASALQNLAVVQSQESFKLGDPVLHAHCHSAGGLTFGKDQILFRQVIEGAQFVFGQVVLRNTHVALADSFALPRREAHVRLRTVGPVGNQFSSRVAVDRVMLLVLHRGKELLRQRCGGVVIDTGCVDVGNFLVEAPFAGANVLQAAGQLVKVIETLAGVFQALVIQHKALDDELLELSAGPLAQAHADLAAHPVAHGQHHIRVVVHHFIGLAIGSSCSEKPNN